MTYADFGKIDGKVAVIGAGSSGIVAAKTLLQRGIDVDVYEAGSNIGGNWAYGNDNGMNAIYWSLYINTSKQLMAYSDFPMPDEYPDYPHHTHIAKYFESYVDRFGFRDKIIFNAPVERLEPLDGGRGGWRVVAQGRAPEVYAAVMVANGHHWDPKFPDFPGTFSGQTMHAHDYKTFRGLENKRVLIVGIGNSAMDISVDLARVAADIAVSVRRGVKILPKYVSGVPLDHWAINTASLVLSLILPEKIGQKMSQWAVERQQGDVERFGMPPAPKGMLGSHPTISSEFLPRVGHGAIRIVPNIKALDGDYVVFVDGRRERFDTIIYATGYNIRFPFLDPALFPVQDNRVGLYKYVVPPKLPNLYFIGLVQPLGAIMPMAELQSRWLAGVMRGKYRLPSAADMERDVEKKWQEIQERYYDSPRHTIQVDHGVYMLELWREMVPPGPLGQLQKRLRIVDPFTPIVVKRVKEAEQRGYGRQTNLAPGDAPQ